MRVDIVRQADDLHRVDVEIQRMEVEAHQQWSARLEGIHTAEALAYEQLLTALAMPDSAEMQAGAQACNDTLTALGAAKQAHYVMLPVWTTMPGAEELINRRERLSCE